MDPLSDLLSLLRPLATLSSGFKAGGDWAIRFAEQRGQIKCYAILSGECWMAVDGIDAPVHLAYGDAFVLPQGRPFRLASDLSLPSTEAATIFPPARAGGTVVLGAKEATFALAGARFAVEGSHATLLLGLLPAVVYVGGSAEQAALRWAVERMMRELHDGLPGGHLMAQNLAHMLLIQALRAALNAVGMQQTGWLAALSDPRLRRALEALHADPARRWTLQQLGSQAGMSRTVFATRFRRVMSETPMQYLTRWRMLLACDRLQHTAEPISLIAAALGYESNSAFSTAFKRVLGCSPQQYKTDVGKPAAGHDCGINAT
ncbi:AraC family transcriptional regulator [Pseudomonas typographi]|uniref:AraC family transcriptional regulator n=1 Tax=Pseudomonas typographi TaxID=2715964 RepID=UPI001682B543|nr:AraC family transcriptional regulator [Pseudomonas typographi]MBD1554467.1 AraC family transcriptional regulator [Pseudomonas typographi]